jgi:hypothetical protein
MRTTTGSELLHYGVSLLTAAAALVGAIAPVQAADKKPDILFILVDNLRYGEIGAYGGGVTRGAATPRIDSPAKEGTRFLNMNMETQCTPSRSSLMTGRLSIRSGTYVYLDEKKTLSLATNAFWEFHGTKKDSDTKVGQILTLEGGLGKSYLGGGLVIGGRRSRRVSTARRE